MSRTESYRKTKIGTEVAHVTSDSDTTFKVKGQRSRSPGRFTHHGVNASGSCSGERGNVLAYCYVEDCTLQARSARRREALRRPKRERGGAYCGGRPPTACFNVVVRKIRDVTGTYRFKNLMIIGQVAQLMLTKPRDAFRGQSRSPSMVLLSTPST